MSTQRFPQRTKAPRARVPVYLTTAMYDALCDAADSAGFTLSQFAAAAIAEKIERLARARLRNTRRRTQQDGDHERA